MNHKTLEAQMRWNDRIINTIARLANKKSIAWEKVMEEHTALQEQLIKEKNLPGAIPPPA